MTILTSRIFALDISDTSDTALINSTRYVRSNWTYLFSQFFFQLPINPCFVNISTLLRTLFSLALAAVNHYGKNHESANVHYIGYARKEEQDYPTWSIFILLMK